MSTHNVCFCWEIIKISAGFGWKKRLICCYGIHMLLKQTNVWIMNKYSLRWWLSHKWPLKQKAIFSHMSTVLPFCHLSVKDGCQAKMWSDHHHDHWWLEWTFKNILLSWEITSFLTMDTLWQINACYFNHFFYITFFFLQEVSVKMNL